MSLQSCPAEILFQILGLIKSQKELLHLSLVSQQFHQAVTPQLYSKFIETDVRSLPLLLRTFVENPLLAQYLKSLEISERGANDPEYRGFLYLLPHYGSWLQFKPQLEAYFAEHNAFHDLGGQEHQKTQVNDLVTRKRAFRAKETYDWEFLACNLLLFARNLEVLRVTCFRLTTSKLLSILTHARRVQTTSGNDFQHSKFGLPKLHSIHLSPWRNYRNQRLDLDNITSILQIPSLVNFFCQGISDEKMLNSIPSRVLLKSLALTDSRLSSNGLDSTISNCNNLERLELGYNPFSFNLEVNPPRILRSLLRLQATLTSLIIMVEGDQGSNSLDLPISDSSPPLPCLSGFTKLRTLEISSQLLLDRRILEPAELDHDSSIPAHLFTFKDLPSGLVHLTIHNASRTIIDLFSAYKFDVFLRLKTVRVKFARFQSHLMDMTVWPTVTKKYREQGIEVSFNYNQGLGDEAWSSF